MLKSPVNIVPLFSGDTLISELQRSSLKFVRRNFDVDGDRYHTLRKLCVREVYFKPNTFQFINFQINPSNKWYVIRYINYNATVKANMSIFVNKVWFCCHQYFYSFSYPFFSTLIPNLTLTEISKTIA